MKSPRKWLVGLSAVVSIAALLLWFLPARWAMPWIEPRLHGLQLKQVQCTLWDGRAGELMAVDGHPLGELRWQLSRRALLGQLRLQLAFDGPQLGFSGRVQRLPDGRFEARGLQLHAELAELARSAAWLPGQPRGELDLTVEHALLQGGWPVQLQGHAQWRQAVIRTQDGDIALGSLRAQAQAQNGVIQAQLRDDGSGPLQADGQLQLSPLGWRLDATLRARQTDPRLRRWLARLGPPSGDGSVHIRHHGGLAGSLPAPSPEKDARQP